MTDHAFLTDTHNATPAEASVAFTHGGHTGDGMGWVVPDTETLIADVVSELAAGPYNAFNHVGSTDLTVTIDTGEAMIRASPVARDTQSTVDLAASTANQVVYVGYHPSQLDSVTIGLDSEFTAEHRRIPLWEYDTQSSSVSSTTDRRTIDEYIKTKNKRYETDDGSGVAVDSAKSLGGTAASNYARLDQDETVTGAWSFEGQNDKPTVHFKGPNETDSNVVIIDGDADSGQDDDLLKVRGVEDPRTQEATDDDTIAVVKGERQVGIGTYYPQALLDIDGTAILRNNLSMRLGDVTGVNTIDTRRVNLDEQGDGAIMAVADPGRLFIAPKQSGEDTPKFGSELTYIAADDTWKFESEGFQAPNASPISGNDDVVTGDDLRRQCSVTLELDQQGAGVYRSAFISTSSNDNVQILRVSMTDSQGNEPPVGCYVRITGEGGGQQKDFATRLAVGSLSDPLHVVSGTGSVRVRLYNESGSTQDLSCHIVIHIL